MEALPRPDPSSPIELVAIDLDGTLLNSRKEIDPRDAAAVRRACETARVVIATARPPRATRHFVSGLGLCGPAVCYNGALVLDLATGERHAERRVPGELGTALVNGLIARWPESWLSFEIDDEWWTDREPPAALVESAKLAPPNRIAPIASFLGAEFHKIYLAAERELTRAIHGWIEVEFAQQVRVIISEEARLLQIVHPAAGKGAAVRALAERFGIAQERVLAIGDDWNDLDLLQWAGVGVAMGNAAPEVKAAAQWVTETNNNAGVAAALSRYMT